MIKIEQWLDIPKYEGYYQVSNMGRVRSLDRLIHKGNSEQLRKGHIKKLILDRDGYAIVNLSKCGTMKKYKVHRLVAELFVPGWFEGAEVNHVDFDRLNNVASNLEWVNHEENIRHTLCHKRHYSQSPRFKNNNPNKGNHILHDKYTNDKDLAKAAQSRPGQRNGRAKSVTAILQDGTSVEFGYLGECARYLIDVGLCKANNIEYIGSVISSAKESGEEKYGCTFK